MVSSNANALGVIFANSYDNLVPELVAELHRPPIPFAGRYRMIDFVLSNMANAVWIMFRSSSVKTIIP